MRVLITGRGGQLAWELERSVPEGVEATFLALEDLDICQKDSVEAIFQKLRPELVINAAAYTAVDRAEVDQKLAHAVNFTGPENLALACKKQSCRLFHVSTDFIFNGQQSQPYNVDQKGSPLGVYGASKWAGEEVVRTTLPQESLIVRTAWVYSSHGQNFVKTMLRLMSEKEQLKVVVDQIGTPTWAKGLAQFLWECSAKPELLGTYHWTDSGVASWYDFAVVIQALALKKGLLKKRIPILPIPTSEYPTPAKRPAYGVLDKTKTEQLREKPAPYWRDQLKEMLGELA
jgi:dTDP-4-dehydrorhamnose reductase